MIFAQIETEEDIEKLQLALRKAEKPSIYKRLLIIQFSAQGKTVMELAFLFNLHPLTIRKYIHAYNQEGIKGLMPAQKSGRPLKLPLTRDQWLDIIHQSPATFENFKPHATTGRWTSFLSTSKSIIG